MAGSAGISESRLGKAGQRLLTRTSDREAAAAFLKEATPDQVVLLLAEHSRRKGGDRLRHQLLHWREELDRILGSE